MSNWTGFLLAIVVLTVGLLLVTRRSQDALADVRIVDGSAPAPDRESGSEILADTAPAHGATAGARNPAITTRALLANVVVSQGVFLIAVVALLWWFGVPVTHLGLSGGAIAARAVGIGVLAGGGIAVLNELGARVGRRVGISGHERLRQALSPTVAADWVLLLLVVLPTIAVFEELLFRGVLIGAFAVGLGVDPWLLVVGSSIVFGLGHGAQGALGVIVTAVLGTVLGGLFVLTGSLVVVIVAHYVINAVEFLVHEGPADGRRR
ncbi:Membrane protease YdiL, CAAX protease family [Halopenitus malekzadehii]|uniref:Membrane protease YdiL, CAAX protease family n=1 Tax=Halopenitus malekzadehii TaxID=1267564 RepID=A0A1H6HVC1_9EURY|nr:type II CAAX endopeptidase family protein [Halopenitus malekzadehii]SEH38064.1 Membrane protease YdiL, CAAX protease family [Halopenitus malekzadehii]